MRTDIDIWVFLYLVRTSSEFHKEEGIVLKYIYFPLWDVFVQLITLKKKCVALIALKYLLDLLYVL